MHRPSIMYTGTRLVMAASLSLVVASHLAADDGNYQNYVLGDRAAGMGGAAVAIADSLDACYYNPAGLSLSEASSLSFSANLYGYQEYRSRSGLFSGEDLRRNSFVSIPSAVGSIWKVDTNLSLAFSAFVPDRISFSEIVAFDNARHLYTFSLDDQTLWIGPSAGYGLSPEWSVGASIFGTYRAYSSFESVAIKEYQLNYSQGSKFYDFGLLGMAGVQYRPTDRLNLGLVLQSPSAHLMGNGRYEGQATTAGMDETDDYTGYMGDLDTDNAQPARATLGVAWQERRHFALSADATYHLATGYNLLDGITADGNTSTWHIARNAVADFNLGAEYYVQHTYPLRGGFFTSYSSSPGRTLSSLENPPQLDKYGVTFSVGREAKHVDVNIGVIYVLGSGQSLGWSARTLERQVVDTASEDIYAFLNSSYHF